MFSPHPSPLPGGERRSEGDNYIMVSIARKNLFHDKIRFIITLIGVTLFRVKEGDYVKKGDALIILIGMTVEIRIEVDNKK